MTDNEGSQQEEQEQEEPRNFLKEEMIHQGLTSIQRSTDGTSYAFVNLNLEEKEIQELGQILRNYQHLRNLNISKNELQDASELVHFPHLLSLNLSTNQISKIDFFNELPETLPYLQILNLSQNKLVALVDIPQPRLFRINLNENEITSCKAFTGHRNLRLLELRKNKIVNCQGLANIPMLEELYLAENEITQFNHLLNLPSLKKLNLRGNKIEIFKDGLPHLPSLEYLNLRENGLTEAKELTQLCSFSKLNYINMKGCPVSDEKGDDFKKEIIFRCETINIQTVNKEELTEEDFADAAAEKQEKIQAEKEAEEEARRLAEEEAQRAKEEAEAEADAE